MSIEIVDVAGDAPGRGRAFGQARRNEIAAWTSAWLSSLQSSGIREPREYITKMLRDTEFLTAIRQHMPDLLEEVHGIASGANLPLEIALAAQYMDEEWAYRRLVLSRSQVIGKCSAVAMVAAGGSTWIGQNMDLGAYTDGHHLIADSLRIKSYEASPEGVREFRPADPSRVLHTNHPFTDLKSAPMSARYEANTIARLNSLTTRLGHGPGGLEAIQAALSSFDDPENPICRLRGVGCEPKALTSLTTGSMISALRDNAVESWVSAGPPSIGGYRHVTLS